MRQSIKIILFLVAVLFWPGVTEAVGVGVNPPQLELSADSQGLARTVLQITNPSHEPGLFTVSSDELSAWFNFNPSELRLEAGETRTVDIKIRAEKAGRYAVNLSVIGYPLDTRAFNAGSGLKVPLRLTVESILITEWWRYAGWGLLGLALVGLGLVWHIHIKQRTWWQRLWLLVRRRKKYRLFL